MDFLKTFATESTGFSPSAINALGELGFTVPNDCRGTRLSIRLDVVDFEAPSFYQDEVIGYGVESCQGDLCPVLNLKKGLIAQADGVVFLFSRLVHIAGSWGLVGLRGGPRASDGCARNVALCRQVMRIN